MEEGIKKGFLESSELTGKHSSQWREEGSRSGRGQSLVLEEWSEKRLVWRSWEDQ